MFLWIPELWTKLNGFYNNVSELKLYLLFVLEYEFEFTPYEIFVNSGRMHNKKHKFMKKPDKEDGNYEFFFENIQSKWDVTLTWRFEDFHW